MTSRIQEYLYVAIYSKIFNKKLTFIRTSYNTEIISDFKTTCRDELIELKNNASTMNKETTHYVGNSRYEFIEICKKWLKKEEECFKETYIF